MTTYNMAIEPRRQVFVRLAGRLLAELQLAYTCEHDARGITRTDIAAALGVHKSVISRRLNGTSNLTLESLADLAWALDHEITISLRPRSEVISVSSNYHAEAVPRTSNVDSVIGLSKSDTSSERQSHGRTTSQVLHTV